MATESNPGGINNGTIAQQAYQAQNPTGYTTTINPATGMPVITYNGYNATTGQVSNPSGMTAFPAQGSTASSASTSAGMPAGIDPALAAIYEKAGVTPGARGTGFADWQYWQGVGPSQYQRLAADLAGTGTDNPEGTPGQGPWDNSGKGANAPASTSAGLSPFTTSLMGQTGLGGTSGQQATDLFNKEMAIANQSTDISPTDPIIKAQTDAYSAADTRAARDAISQAAEAGGANSDIGATTRSAMEKVGQDTAGFTASAMQTELQARRNQIAQALQGASGLLTADQQLQLTQQLGLIDSALQKYGIDVNESEYFSPFNPSYTG